MVVNRLMLPMINNTSKEALWSAKIKIEEALKEAGSPPETYWDAGVIYQRLAEFSGEVDDLFNAIFHFEKCSSEAMPDEFWNDFGKAYTLLSEKVNDIRLTIKAIQCYKQALSKTLSNLEGWMGLGKSLKRLYQFTHENDHFQQACDCFAAAIHLNPLQPQLWLERIEFLIEAARIQNDPAKLRTALERCEQAAALTEPVKQDLRTSLDPEKWGENQSLKIPAFPFYINLLGLWAEALALLGEWNERIALIREAEKKIDLALELSKEDDPSLLLQHGKCLYSFAQYYCDLDLYYQAIEAFQFSLSIDRTQIQGWIWMGKTYATIFDGLDDAGALKKALRFYQKALQIKTDPFLYFEFAKTLIKLGEMEEESELIKQALDSLEYLLQTYKPLCYEHPEWFFFYGVALDLLGKCKEEISLHQKSIEAFINVLMLDPNHPFIHHRIGLVYSHLGDTLDEIDYLYRALHHFRLAERTQKDEEALYIDWAEAWIHLSEHATDAVMEENCLREAEQKLIYATQLGSQDAFYQLACLYSIKGFFSLSLQYLRKAHAAKTVPSIEMVQEDAWLEGVRLSPEFQEFLALLQKS